jgi:pimeloyl-ACP methyl ester carboxylesterase
VIAAEPTSRGSVGCRGSRVAYAVYGDGEPTVLLMPTWSIFPSRFWRLQVPFLSRHYRVITFDGRGTGGSDAPTRPDAYSDRAFAADALAVLDATGTRAAVAVALSCGATWGLRLGAEHPERVLGLALLSPAVPLAPPLPERSVQRFHDHFDEPVGWQKYNAGHWRAHYSDFVDFFVAKIASEPHSTKTFDDGVAWASAIDPEVLIAADLGLCGVDERLTRELGGRVGCPCLVIHGTDDRVRAFDEGVALAELLGAELVTVPGGGHSLMSRQPVLVNRTLRSFVERCARTRGLA